MIPLSIRALAHALPLTLLVATAQASDGVAEINQACAVNTGCVAGDTAGFPVSLGASPGNDRLTSDL